MQDLIENLFFKPIQRWDDLINITGEINYTSNFEKSATNV